MSRYILSLVVLPVFSCICAPVFAQDPEEERPYDASVAVGYVGTSGNTEITTLNTEFLLTYREASWTHNFALRTLTSREDGIGKAERYVIRDKSDYSLLDEDRYLFVQGSFIDDRFSGFDYQALISTGYGQYFIRNDRHTLEGFAGIGYRQNDEQGVGTQGEVVLTLGEGYDWVISETSSFTQDLMLEIGDKRTITTFSVGLESNILDRISTRIAFELRNTSDVPPGIEKTDTETSINLVYTF